MVNLLRIISIPFLVHKCAKLPLERSPFRHCLIPSCASFAKTVCWERVDRIHVSIDDCLCFSQTDFDGRRLELSYVQWYYSAWRAPQSRWNFRQLVFYSPCCTGKLYPWGSNMSSSRLSSIDLWQNFIRIFLCRSAKINREFFVMAKGKAVSYATGSLRSYNVCCNENVTFK